MVYEWEDESYNYAYKTGTGEQDEIILYPGLCYWREASKMKIKDIFSYALLSLFIICL